MSLIGKIKAIRHKASPIILPALLAGVVLVSAGCTAGSPEKPSDGSLQKYGNLDTSFGDGGKVVTDLGSDLDEVYGITVLSGGKILAVGESWPEPGQQPGFTLVRYNANGKLDTTFGEGGKAFTAINKRSSARAFAVQPDGKIVVAGQAHNPDVYRTTFALARYNSDGSLDGDFGDNGSVVTSIGVDLDESMALAVAIQPDGKIVAAGSFGAYFFSSDFAVARYNADGSPDTSFGEDGQMLYDSGLGGDTARAIAIQPDGKIVVGGNISEGAGNDDFGAIRLTRNGDLDKSFGDGGMVRTDMLGGTDWAYGVSLLPNGKILLGGYSQIYCSWECERYGFGLSQYNPDGSPDASFGDEGKVFYDFISSSGAYSMARRDDGKIVLAGHIGNDEFAVALFNADGSLDNSFGEDGLTRVDFGPYADRADAVAVQPDGKIIAAGRVVVDPNNALNSDFGLARFEAPPMGSSNLK